VIGDGLIESFRRWHSTNPDCNGWGLAWYFAAEFVGRFHVSHGHEVYVIKQEGLGYYGIAVGTPAAPRCIEREPRIIGRFTMAGNVENWSTGSPGDHGLQAVRLVVAGADPADLMPEVVRHLGMGPHPSQRHRACRHRHRGSSYVLVVNVIAQIALRHSTAVAIDSLVDLRRTTLTDPDAQAGGKDPPGYFRLRGLPGDEIAVSGDGRVISGGRLSKSLWEQYMAGASVGTLVDEVERGIGLSGR
jgi:hypothetical protein